VGTHESKIKEMIMRGNPGDEDDYSVLLSKYTHTELSTFIMDPHPVRFKNIKFYRFYFNTYRMYIKVDSRVAIDPIDMFVLSPNRPATIVMSDFSKSKELQVAKKIIAANS
jgi:hypothetical protein